MQAIEIQSFLPDSLPYHSLKVSTVSRPQPTKDQVLVRITHVSLHQVDLLFARGKHQNNNAKHGHVLPPFILGMDFAGIVDRAQEQAESMGDDQHTHQKTLCAGDRVMGQCYGACAEYLSVHPSQVVKIPTNLDPAAAASLVGGVVSYAAVKMVADIHPGQTVLVTGANGGLGAVACQVASHCGAKVIALVSSANKKDILRSHVELECIVTTDEPDWVQQVKGLSQGGVDAVIDNVGLVEDGLRCLKAGGSIVIVGFAGRGGVMETVAMNRVLLKSATVIGYRFGEQSRQNPRHLQQAWEGYSELLGSGQMKAVVDPNPYQGLGHVPRALQDLADRKLRGRAVVVIAESGTSKL